MGVPMLPLRFSTTSITRSSRILLRSTALQPTIKRTICSCPRPQPTTPTPNTNPSRPASKMTQPPQEVIDYLKQSHGKIFDNNRKWAESKQTQDPGYFARLSEGQTPEYSGSAAVIRAS